MTLVALPQDILGAPARIPARDRIRADLCQIAGALLRQCHLGAAPFYDRQDQERFDRLAELALLTSLSMVASGEVIIHRLARRPLADVLTCLRLSCTIDNFGANRLAG